MLLRRLAEVSLFLANGFAEVPTNHAVPEPDIQPKK